MRSKPEVNSDLSQILLPYENKWAALSADKRRVLWSSESLSDFATVKDKIKEPYTLFKVLPFDLALAPASV